MAPRKNLLFYITNLFVVLALGIAPVRAAPAPAPEVAEQQAALLESQNLAQTYTQQNAIAVEVGESYTCALTSGGGVKCWGSNYTGQLGDGTTSHRYIPVYVSGLSSGVTAITAGGYHTCALTTSGGVKCWGGNGYGQLGDNTFTSRSIPVDVSGLSSGVTAISAGEGHTCALTTSGGVMCWGYNGSGQLGDGTTTSHPTPVAVSGLSSGVMFISAGGNHTCALTTSGGMKCWGANGYGQLGDNTPTSRSIPGDVSGLSSGVAVISTGDNHTCAATNVGGMKCWGSNYAGQLGDDSRTNRFTPVNVSGLSNGVTAISAGEGHTCAVTTNDVMCWGHNYNGQLGNGTTAGHLTPVNVSGLSSGITAISASSKHTCALAINGGVKCWGNNWYGQLGANIDWKPPVDVSELSNSVTAISAGGGYTCALTNGNVKCWGSNNSGQLGDGSGINRYTPKDVSGLSNGVTAVSTGYLHACALAINGGVKCWGRNEDGQLGDGTTNLGRSTPGDVNGLSSGVIAISADRYHTCALTSGGGVKCWGNNSTGQLGDGSITDHTTPVDVSGLSSGVTAISVGRNHTCALTASGGVKCWGDNFYGQLGDGTNTYHSTPVDVSGLSSGVTGISARGFHTCVLTTIGGVKCWGGNFTGQLGDGTNTSRSTSVDVSGLSSGVMAISAGEDHTCALTTSGDVKCWGWNLGGALGDGSTTNRSKPVNVNGLSGSMTAISAGSGHTCALTSGGGVKCWGSNGAGQLGVNPGWAPVNVIGFGPESEPLAYLYIPLIQR